MRLKSVIWSTFFLLLGIIFGVIIHFLITLRSADEHQSYVAFQHTITPNHGKPFLLGFTSLGRETSIAKLKIDGKIPAWINGTFVSIGPGKFEINESKAQHWLDGFAMIHRFNIAHGSVSYANKLIKTNYYQESIKQGTITGTTPSKNESVWSKLRTALAKSATQPTYDNVNINIFSLGKQLMALTETPHPICFDCNTLETQSPVTFSDNLSAHFSSAHPLFDPETNEWYNIAIQYARQSSYVIYKINDQSHERVPIATIKVSKPSYLHSFGLTKKYIILTEMPLRVSPYDLLMAKKSFIETHKWDPKSPTIFTVIDRDSGKIVKKFKTHAFFTLHHVNAFDTRNSIILDIVTYKNPAILEALGFDHLYHADKHNFPPGTLERFELNLSNQKVSHHTLSSKNIELPQINYRTYAMHPYTYVYGTSHTSPQQFANQIVKINIKTGNFILWQAQDCYTTEPIFIPSPQGKAEDDGVILCNVLDTKAKHSFLVFIDAKTMKEIGRAQVPHHIPFTVHSNFLLGLINK